MRETVALYLLIRVHLHDRFHGMSFGAPEWPPAPARVFQALIAGAARGRNIAEDHATAFRWLERQAPPDIAAPRSIQGEECTLYVPSNDMDSVGGEPTRLEKLRTKKLVVPRILEGDEPILYVWSIEPADRAQAEALIECAENLSHLGRGVDPAWASAEVVDADCLARVLAEYPGTIFYPAGRGAAEPGSLNCPVEGSFDSTERRVRSQRIQAVSENGKRKELYQSPSRPVFSPVRYQSQAALQLFELVDSEGERGLAAQALRHVVRAVESIRDAAADRLKEAFPGEREQQEVDRLLYGRLPDGSQDRRRGGRIRLLPLPSIGHEHADQQIRRVAIELPSESLFAPADLLWAFEGLVPSDPVTGEKLRCVLSRAREGALMLDRYSERSKRFVSVTPVVLPVVAARRRIDPAKRRAEAKGAAERSAEESQARVSVLQALRHAGFHTPVRSIRVQREPLARKGLRAESFAEGTRFAKERLWHVEIEFASDVKGPLVIGDGRFLGLGLLRPARPDTVELGCWAFELDPAAAAFQPTVLVRAFRRAVLARLGALEGGGKYNLETYFTGHEVTGEPDKSGEHLAFHWDPHARWLLVVAPHRIARRPTARDEEKKLERLDRALAGFHALRVNGGDPYSVLPVSSAALRQYCMPRRHFASIHPYSVTRHLAVGDPRKAIELDLLAECERNGLPRPEAQVVRYRTGAQGLQGWLRLGFAHAVEGPILLGKTRFIGGGLFLPVELPTEGTTAISR